MRKEGHVREVFRKWWPVGAFVLLFVAAFLFIIFGGEQDKTEAHYVQGVQELTLDGVSYVLLNDIESENYIGSMVSSILKGCRGERIGSIQSYGIMVVAVLFEVPGDTEHKYLTDSNDRLYVRKDCYEETKSALENPDYLCDYRMVGEDKDMEGLQPLSKETMEAIRTSKENGEEVTVTDKAFVVNYNNRREVFAFSEDGFLYQARYELFLYNNEVYVTTHFEGNEDTTREQILKGVRLPDEFQTVVKEMWNQ